MEDSLETWMRAVAFFTSTEPVLLTVQDGCAILMRQDNGSSGGEHQLSLQKGDLQQLLREALDDETEALDDETKALDEDTKKDTARKVLNIVNCENVYYKC